MSSAFRQHQLRLVAGFILAGALFGIAYALIAFPFRADGVLRGILAGGLIAGGIVGWEIAPQTGRVRTRLRRLAFLPFVAAKSLIWVAWIVLVLVLVRLLLPIPGTTLFGALLGDVAYSLAASVAIVLAFELDRLVGPGMTWRLVTGRYHTPLVEERAFLLLDIVGSTAIAERIGPARFLALLDHLIGELTPALVEHRAEIYRYVGDAILVTWPLALAVEDARCVRCLAAVAARLQAVRPDCRRRFGVDVEGRAALHAGPVAVGEIGDLKREITMLGDTLNTASKLEKIAGELGRSVVISHELLHRLRLPDGVAADPLGSVEVPGRSQRMELYALRLWPG